MEVSGLLGPVWLTFGGQVELRLEPADEKVFEFLMPVVRVWEDEAEIRWRTVFPSLGSVIYGEGVRLGSQAKEVGVPRTRHSIVLGGLKPEQGHRFRVVDEKTSSEVMEFATGTVNVLAGRRGGRRVRASSEMSGNFPAESVIDGDRTGRGWQYAGGGWNDETKGQWPDWIEVELPTATRIGRVHVFTLQDAFGAGTFREPTAAMRFSKYGLVDFEVQLNVKDTWVTVGRVESNDRVWRTVRFKPRGATGVRVVVHKGKADYSRIVELEAFAR